jgi:hypothetical protein
MLVLKDEANSKELKSDKTQNYICIATSRFLLVTAVADSEITGRPSIHLNVIFQ